MNGLSDRVFFLLAVVLYGVSVLYSVFLWRRGFRRDNRVIYLLVFAALGLHTVAMMKRGFLLSRCPVNNLYEATIFAAWGIAAAYVVIGLWRRLRFLGVFASPVLFAVGIFALMPGLDAHELSAKELNVWGSVHAALVLLAYGAFGLSAVAAMMYLTEERDLKRDKLRAAFALVPPIQRLELVIGRSVVAGFALLTVGLVVGAISLHYTKTAYSAPDAKVIWSAFVWFAYLVLLVLRMRHAQTGRRFAWSALGSFCFILLTFWSSNLLSGIHHP